MHSTEHMRHYTTIPQVHRASHGWSFAGVSWAGTTTGEIHVCMEMGGVKERKRKQEQRAQVCQEEQVDVRKF